MHRAVLQACTPCLIALVIAFVLLRLAIRMSGARWEVRRLLRLHRCQRGGVQSLAFVLTMPIFIMIVMFIVQVSQLMIGTMVVNYAAFAAARSASVWLPAQVIDRNRGLWENENVVPAPASDSTPIVLSYYDEPLQDDAAARWVYSAGGASPQSAKFAMVFRAGVLACTPLGPSRDLGYQTQVMSEDIQGTVRTLYARLVPQSQAVPRIAQRLDNKVAYAFENTFVRVQWYDKNSRSGPTYNPRVAVRDTDGRVLYDDSGDAVRTWNPQEVGWQDPLTVTVTHNFALLPGPARFLATFLVRADGQPDRVSHRIERTYVAGNREIYTTPIWASATITNEGIKSVLPYVQNLD